MVKLSRRAVLSGFAGGAAALGAGSLTAGAQPSSTPGRRRGGRVREYWLQIESMPHDIIPTGMDQLSGRKVTVRRQLTALVYRAYDANWRHPLPGSASLGPNTGFPGPVLRAEVGDQLIVHVRNADTHYR